MLPSHRPANPKVKQAVVVKSALASRNRARKIGVRTQRPRLKQPLLVLARAEAPC